MILFAMDINKDEFEIFKGRKPTLDDFNFHRSWQKGYGHPRFSHRYVSACYNFEQYPEAVYKVVSFGRGAAAVRDMMEYVINRDITTEAIDKETGEIKEIITPEAQNFYTEAGEELKGNEAAKEIYKEWAKDWRKKGSGRGEQRHTTHILLSANVSPTAYNSPRVLAAAEQTLRDNFGDEGFRYIFVLHRDTEHAHVHAVINNYNDRTKLKLRQDRHDLLRVRDSFAVNLKDKGLSHIATLRRDRPHILQKIKELAEQMYSDLKVLKKAMNACPTALNRKSQLSAQLTKKTIQYDFKNTIIDYKMLADGKYTQLKLNKIGKPYEKALYRVAKFIKSPDFVVDGILPEASIIFKHTLTSEQKVMIADKFMSIMEQYQDKQDKDIANKATNVLPQYNRALKRLTRLIKMVKNTKKLTSQEKRYYLQKAQDFKNNVLNSKNMSYLLESSFLKTSLETDRVANMLLRDNREKPEYRNYKLSALRRLSLKKYAERQTDDIGNIITQMQNAPEGSKESRQHKQEIIKLLKGITNARDYNQIINANKKLRERLINTNIKNIER